MGCDYPLLFGGLNIVGGVNLSLQGSQSYIRNQALAMILMALMDSAYGGVKQSIEVTEA